MKRSTMPVVSLVVTLMLLLVSAVAYAQQGGQRFTAQLSGGAEVPGPGDPDGSGMATVTVNADGGEVCFELSWMNIMQPAAAAHIHEGAADVAGPVVVPFFTEPMQGTSASNCVRVDDDAVLDGIMTNPANYYVNVHNQEYPQGAIRGQLTMAAAVMPGTGASSEDTLPFIGLAVLVLLAGFGLQRGVRRATSVR
jgi:hypothetical protein